LNKRIEWDEDGTHDLSFVELCIDSPKNTTSGFNYENLGSAKTVAVSQLPTTEFILPSAKHSRQFGTTNSSYATPSSTTYLISVIGDPPLESVHPHRHQDSS